MDRSETYFAPAERAGEQEVAAEHRRLSEIPLVSQLLNSFPDWAMVLNAQRQVVLVNDKLAAALQASSSQLLGLRVGELLHCEHAHEEPSGCGATKFCSQCGAARAMVACGLTRQVQVEECRITCDATAGSRALDLRVWATPLSCGGDFTVFAVRDITDEKRRAVLERIFFHDVLNSAGGVKSIIEILPTLSEAEASQMLPLARDLARQMIEEIHSQRDLLAAERGEITAALKPMDVAPLLHRLCALYRSHTVCEGKHIVPPEMAGQTTIVSDEVLLSRVLGNLIKNALEASSPGDTVKIAFNGAPRPVISVHNPASMPEPVRLQIFQRSFSTKASTGRGIGTYSVKLLTEQYLKGTVYFHSSETTGTTFTVELPAPA